MDGYFDANDYCLYHYNTTLATIISDESNQVAISLCNQTTSSTSLDALQDAARACWIGIEDYDDNGVYLWLDATNTTISSYSDWLQNASANSGECGAMTVTWYGRFEFETGWSSRQCYFFLPFLCNFKTISILDPTLEPSQIPTQAPIFSTTNSRIETTHLQSTTIAPETTKNINNSYSTTDTALCFNNSLFPTTALYLDYCAVQNISIFDLYESYLSLSNSSITSEMYENLYTNMEEFASSFTNYIICNEEQSNYNISDKEFESLVSYQSSQLSLALDTDPTQSDSIVTKLEVIEILTIDLTEYSDTETSASTVYDAKYTQELLETVDETVTVLVKDALSSGIGVELQDAVTVVETLSNIQSTRKHTIETFDETVANAHEIENQINAIMQVCLITFFYILFRALHGLYCFSLFIE